MVAFIISTCSCFFWINVILITTFEWQLITTLVKFQADKEDEDIATLKDEFRKKENTLIKVYIINLVWNLFYHVTKIAIYFIYMKH